MSETTYNTYVTNSSLNVQSKQSNVLVDNVDIYTPNQSVYKFTDDMFDLSGRYYTHVTPITTNEGVIYYGVRRKNLDRTAKTTNTYDVDAIVVKLNSTITQDTIYSFVSGNQYVKVSPDWCNNDFASNNKLTYETIIGQLSNNSYANKDLLFTYSYATYAYVKTDVPYNSFPEAYMALRTDMDYCITASYTYEIQTQYSAEIKQYKPFLKSDNYTYEGRYEEVDTDTFEPSTYISLYKKDITYLVLPNDCKKALQSNFEAAQKCCYTYDTIKHTYKPITLSDVSYFRNNIYERYEVYTQILDIDNNTKTDVTYTKKYIYSSQSAIGDGDVSDKENAIIPDDLMLLYATTDELKAKDIYIPQGHHIVTDDSVKYYGYTYSKLSDEALTYYKGLSDDTCDIYVKQEYRQLTSDTEVQKYINNGSKLYTCKANVKQTKLSISIPVDSLVTDGSVIYSYNSTSLDVSYLTYSVTKQINNSCKSKSEYDVIRKMTLSGIEETVLSATKIVDTRLDFAGTFAEVKNPTADASNKYYVKEPGYTKISNKLISVGSSQEYYTYRIDIIDPRSIKNIKTVNNVGPYLDVTEFNITDVDEYLFDYKYPENNNKVMLASLTEKGLAKTSKINYYFRIDDVSKSSDMFLCSLKQYYKKTGSATTISTDGISTLIPISEIDYSQGKILYENPNYVYDESSVKYYKNSIIKYNINTNCGKYKDLKKNFDKSNEFIYTKYLYSTYTINGGVLQEKNGKPYVDIYVFDRKLGAISKKLYLNEHIIEGNDYDYDYSSYVLTKVSTNTLDTIVPANYDKYYYGTNPKAAKQCTLTGNSPEYYSYSYNIYTYTAVVNNSKYDGMSHSININGVQKATYDYCYSTIDEQGKEQRNQGKPKTIIQGDTTFGLLFSNEMYSYSYDYEIVQLYNVLTADAKINKEEILKNEPFVITNDTAYVKTGTYTWHNPTYTYVISGNKIVKKQTKDGYWEANYDKETIPLTIASYTFYPDSNSISNVSATYSFVPNSYVLTSVVEYPEISYESIVSEFDEYEYYSYTYGNNTYIYTGIPVEKDGNYYGIVNGSSYQLYKHTGVSKNVLRKEIVNQEHSVSYTYFAYKTSLALTNEKIPVLYNTELMPMIMGDVSVWDDATSTYVTKTVPVSYAYYSYQYYYDTIPFKIASYNFQASYLTIDNFDKLGAYILNGSNSVANLLSYEIQRVDSFTNTFNDLITSEVSTISNAYNTLASSIDTGIDTFAYQTYLSRNQLSDDLLNVSTVMSYNTIYNTNTIKNSAEELTNTVDNNFCEFIDKYSYQNNTNRDVISYSFETLTSYINKDLIGDISKLTAYSIVAVNKDNEVVWETVSYSGVIESIKDALTSAFVHPKTKTTEYSLNGLSYTITQYSYEGVGTLLSRLEIINAIPTKQEFIMDLAPKMFAAVDFDTEVVDSVKYDESGNVTEKKTHKKNPSEVAKKTIYRASILWDELTKAGYTKQK